MSRSLLMKAIIAILALLLLIFLSPLWVFVSIIALLVVGIILVIKAARGRPLRSWGIISAGCFALLVTSCSATALVYGGDTEEVAEREAVEAPAPATGEQEATEAEEVTRYVTVEETVERTVEQTVAAPVEEEEEVEEEPQEEAEEDREQAPVVAPAPVATEEEESSNGRISVAVASVTDGDTIEIAEPVEGLTDVRLIGMDTPETYGGEEPLGPEASSFAEGILSGQTVELELDEEVVDSYDRLLAYVYLPSGEMFNELVVAEGYAQVATFPPNVRYEGDFFAAQSSAQAAGLGIWSLPEDQLCQLADRGNGIGGGCEEQLPVVQPEPAPVPGIEEPPIVEQVAPVAPTSGATDGWYEGAPDLDCADFSSAVTVSPGDPFALDADGDGIGCDS